MGLVVIGQLAAAADCNWRLTTNAAVRWTDWKISFAAVQGNIATASRVAANWPLFVNMCADPYEQTPAEAEMGYLRWYADNMWLFMPVQQKIGAFLRPIPGFPFQDGGSLIAAGINDQSLEAMEAINRLQAAGQLPGAGRPVGLRTVGGPGPCSQDLHPALAIPSASWSAKPGSKCRPSSHGRGSAARSGRSRDRSAIAMAPSRCMPSWP